MNMRPVERTFRAYAASPIIPKRIGSHPFERLHNAKPDRLGGGGVLFTVFRCWSQHFTHPHPGSSDLGAARYGAHQRARHCLAGASLCPLDEREKSALSPQPAIALIFLKKC